MRIVIGIACVMLSLACHRPSTARVASVDATEMDSATVERLCEYPDSVRAGKVSCVLKNQAPPIRPYVVPPRTP